MLPEFKGFSKIKRLSRNIIITEKLDGTNGLVYIDYELNVFAGSHNTWLDIHKDNQGFANWVENHKEELKQLGPGYHYGEFWGKGIQRGYNLQEKRFSLFNVSRWVKDEIRKQYLPNCCLTVPILYEGIFDTELILGTLQQLKMTGSNASPGYMNPEGIVIFHTAANICFKKTFLNDEKGKGE